MHIMPGYQEKITRHVKGKKENLKRKSKHQSQTQIYMAGMLELSDQEFKTTMINMLRSLVDKVDNMREQAVNISKERNSKKQPKRSARDQNIVTEMKNSFDWLISRLDMAKERISEFKNITNS